MKSEIMVEKGNEGNAKEAPAAENAAPQVQQEAKPAVAETAQVKPRKRAAPRSAPSPAVPSSKEEVLLFGKFSYNVELSDLSLKNYINLTKYEYPNTFRRFVGNDFSKTTLNIVERLENYLMRGGTGKKVGGHFIRTKGRLQGKKLKVMHIIEAAFDTVNRKTGENPLQVFVKALENSAPIEDTTRVRYGGVVANVTVDISASKRLDVALRNIAHATIIDAFNKKRRIVDALADELILTANNDINSYAIKRKNEIERMARSAR